MKAETRGHHSKESTLPVLRKRKGTFIEYQKSISFDKKTLKTEGTKAPLFSHMPTFSLVKSSDMSDSIKPRFGLKTKNRLAFLASPKKLNSIVTGPSASTIEEIKETYKPKLIYEQTFESKIKKLLKFLVLEREGFEENGSSDLHILQSKIKSFMAKIHDINDVIKTHNTNQLYMLAEDLFYQCQTLGIGVLINSYVTFFLHLVHRLSKKEKVVEATKILFDNAHEWKLDAGLMVADYFIGMRYSEEMKHELALRVYFRMLLVALCLEDMAYEMKAYDLIGKQYYYLNDLDKSIFFHNRFISGTIEPLDSMFRAKLYKDSKYNKDETLVEPFLVEENMRKQKDLREEIKPTLSRLADIRAIKAKMIQLDLQMVKQLDLYQVISGQKRRFLSDKSKDKKSYLLGNPKKVLLTHLSIDRNIKPISDLQPIEISTEEGMKGDELSVDFVTGSNNSSEVERAKSRSEAEASKSKNKSRTDRSVASRSMMSEDRQSLYRPKITHSMVKQMTKKKSLTNSDIIDLLKLLDSVYDAISQVNAKISECISLYVYIDQGLIVKDHQALDASFKPQPRKKVSASPTPLMSRRSLLEAKEENPFSNKLNAS